MPKFAKSEPGIPNTMRTSAQELIEIWGILAFIYNPRGLVRACTCADTLAHIALLNS